MNQVELMPVRGTGGNWLRAYLRFLKKSRKSYGITLGVVATAKKSFQVLS